LVAERERRKWLLRKDEKICGEDEEMKKMLYSRRDWAFLVLYRAFIVF
jgi:hypothetical protein